ncbi:hypothetical protein ADZ36_29495 [Streptomyces fradiae]|uniref:Secreted protein n=2 Tax=Streptomyces TaxID=1883 RepID=A0A420V0R5_9ACTN|nr:hypothetical protein ADZ36_29495 [Streptomyces fradiae]PQM19929.1 hypothetical protein Sfr7A_29640 [Streptomyces xinghaiensis]RKM94068.1 hypothetical protein SFRA_019960 [Streptomyces xinghaiensis]RNC69275.1 hypothetical protein DC095_029960 [Streptomyces xinghaiensis]
MPPAVPAALPAALPAAVPSAVPAGAAPLPAPAPSVPPVPSVRLCVSVVVFVMTGTVRAEWLRCMGHFAAPCTGQSRRGRRGSGSTSGGGRTSGGHRADIGRTSGGRSETALPHPLTPSGAQPTFVSLSAHSCA